MRSLHPKRLLWLTTAILAISCGKAIATSPVTDSAPTWSEYTKNMKSTLTGAVHSLAGAPDGMSINPVTGTIYWTPTAHQVGSYQISVNANNGNQSTTQSLYLNVTAGFTPNLNQAYFISPSGSNTTGNGTAAKPYFDTKPLCENANASYNIAPGSTVYFRGGTYRNPGFGTGNLNNQPIRSIACKGTASQKITIRPWGNERSKIQFDSFMGVEISGQFVVFRGFEIEGVAQRITVGEAIANWWTENKYFNGNGIVVKGAGVEVRDNIVHDVPGSGINTSPEADLVTVDNNIVFNTSWWSTKGTTAIGLVGINKNQNIRSSVSTTARVTASNNLVFASESRIASRVFSKGFANLTVDEGSSMLIKSDGGTYDRPYTINHNFFFYNGKGISLRAPDIELQNNSMYGNGTTMSSLGAGLRANNNSTNTEAIRMKIEGNAVQVPSGKNAIDFDPTATISMCSGNTFAGGISNGGICATTSSNTLLPATNNVFVDPESLNFSVSQPGVGANVSVLEAHKAKLASYGYAIGKTGYAVDYATMRQGILDNIPSSGTLTQIDSNRYLVTFPDTNNVTGSTSFELRWE